MRSELCERSASLHSSVSIFSSHSSVRFAPLSTFTVNCLDTQTTFFVSLKQHSSLFPSLAVPLVLSTLHLVVAAEGE